MNINAEQLPDNVVDLKKIVLSNNNEIRLLKEENDLLRHKLFGKKSEKLSRDIGSGQLFLFNEAEQAVDENTIAEQDQVHVPAHTKRRGKRKPLPENLPRIEVLHDLGEEEKQCSCGTEKSRLGEETSEQLDYIPPKIQVIKHIRPKYVCRNCEGTDADEPAISIAPMPDQLLPKSIATPGLIAQIITAKYVDGLPLYRQAAVFDRLGIELKRQTMAAWVIKVAEKCSFLVELMCREIRSGPYVQIDETLLQVLDEPGRKATTKSYMWVFRGGDSEKPTIVYQYHPTRSSGVPRMFLGSYQGYVQTDGYVGYDFLDDLPGVEHLGCWAHVRRKFMEVERASGKKGSKKKKSRAETAIDYITKLYAIEQSARARDLDAGALYSLRQKKAVPLLKSFREWLDETELLTPPKGLLGSAVSYALKQWGRLTVYLQDGRLQPDNNLTENAIRPFVIGRKNFLFSATPAGAHSSAALYSLIETAKANGLEPYWYLRFLFERLPTAKSEADLRALLPHYADRTQIGPSA